MRTAFEIKHKFIIGNIERLMMKSRNESITIVMHNKEIYQYLCDKGYTLCAEPVVDSIQKIKISWIKPHIAVI